MMVSDIQQIFVVAKNESVKSIRGRKFLISLAIVIIVFGLITLLQFVSDGGWDSIQTTSDILTTYLTSISIVILLVVALLSSIALVSEFEERTALILFTRPVRRTSIIIGKALSCLAIEAFIILVYYILVCIVSLIKVGGVSGNLAVSFGMAVMYMFAASGVAFVISAYFKRGSVCTIISLLLLLVIIPIFTSMIGGDTWYMLDTAGNTIITCVPEYVDSYNEMAAQFAQVVNDAAAILEGFTSENVRDAIEGLNAFMASPDFAALDVSSQESLTTLAQFLNMETTENISGMVAVLKMLSVSSLIAPIENPDIARETLVLLVWGVVGYFIAWIRFVRREF